MFFEGQAKSEKNVPATAMWTEPNFATCFGDFQLDILLNVPNDFETPSANFWSFGKDVYEPNFANFFGDLQLDILLNVLYSTLHSTVHTTLHSTPPSTPHHTTHHRPHSKPHTTFQTTHGTPHHTRIRRRRAELWETLFFLLNRI